jgi:sulfite reductase (ferredoxin)
VISSFDPLFAAWSRSDVAAEGFGDFCTRVGKEALLELLPQARSAA